MIYRPTMKTNLSFFLLLILLSFNTIAQEKNQADTSSKELKAVIIFASPYEAKKQMPITYSQLDSSAIRALDYGAEPSFMLQRFPSVSYSTDNGTNFGYSYFRLRGFDQSRINITINGMPLNEPEDAGTYFSNFASLLSNSSSVQLQRGLGLSKNGAPAFAGSLDFETFQSVNSYTVIGAEAGSFASGRFSAEREDGNEKNLFFFKLNFLHTDGFKYHSENRSESSFFQWQHRGNKTQFQYLLLAGKNMNGLGWLGVTDSAAHSDFKSNGNAEREKGDFFQSLQQFHITTKLKNNQTFHVGMFFNYTTGDYNFDLYNFLGIPSRGPLVDYLTHSSYGGLLTDYHIKGRNFSFTGGVYGSLYRKTHDAKQYPPDSMIYHNYGNKNEVSPFIKFIYRKNNFYFFSDLQYRFAMFSYHGNAPLKDFQWNFFNPLAGAGYRLNEDFYLYASAGNIKREPGRNDIFLGNDNLQKDSAGNAVYADLLPENNFSIEAGIRFQKKNVAASLNFYRMKILNSIDLNGQIGPTGVPLHSNVAKAIRRGIESEWNVVLFKNWQLLQSISWAPHYIAQDGDRSIPVLTPKWISFTEFQFEKRKWYVALQARYQSKSYIDFANKYVLPDETTFNFLVKYNYRKFFFTLRLINLTDQKIYSSGQLNVYGKPIYQVQAPLSFLAGIEVRF